VWFEFDGAVYIFVFKGFIEVAPIAEDAPGWVPAVDVPLLGVVRVCKEI
jgi:hypothetical protein